MEVKQEKGEGRERQNFQQETLKIAASGKHTMDFVIAKNFRPEGELQSFAAINPRH